MHQNAKMDKAKDVPIGTSSVPISTFFQLSRFRPMMRFQLYFRIKSLFIKIFQNSHLLLY